MRRDFHSVSVLPAFQGHFNHSVGAYVSSMREFKDHLKRGSEAQSLRTGVDHNYVPVDPGEGRGVTESGLDETRKRRRELGIDQPKRKLFT